MNIQQPVVTPAISDKMFLGFFDADGSILINIEKTKKVGGLLTFTLDIDYEINQEMTRKDAVEMVAAKFNATVSYSNSNNRATFKGSSNTPHGQKVRALLNQNPPLCPGRYHDYLLSEEIIKFFQSRNAGPLTKEDLVFLAHLAYNNYRGQQGQSRQLPLDQFVQKIGASPSEMLRGEQRADAVLNPIKTAVQNLEAALPTTTLSTDYIRGSHIGDGTLMVATPWKSTANSGRRRIEPIWSIVNQSKNYCQAFVYTLNAGNVSKTSDKGQKLYQFVVVSKKSCSKFLYVFENTWLPAYKLDQFVRFQEVLEILDKKEHFTAQGNNKVIDLTYGYAQKGSRSSSKDDLKRWGLDWLLLKDYITQAEYDANKP